MMKTDRSCLDNIEWSTNAELPQLTHEECLPVIGSCQALSMLSNLDPSERAIQNSLEIPQSIELIMLQNCSNKISTPVNNNVKNLTMLKGTNKHGNNKNKPMKSKTECYDQWSYVFCDLCLFFGTKDKLTEHLKSVHEDGKMLKLTQQKCPGCTNIFYHKESFRSHLIYDHLVNNSDLNKIMQVSAKKKANCYDPAENNTTKNNLPVSLHYKNESDLEYIVKMGNLNTEKILSEKVNVLVESDTTVSGELNKNINLSAIDINENVEKAINNCIRKENSLSKFLDDKKMLNCTIPLCKVHLQNLEKLTYHIKCHVDKSFKCPECKDVFSLWKPLTGHLWRMHNIDMELYSCDKCEYKTFSLGKLNNVHRLIHSDTKPFVCDHCPRAFKNMKQLRNHKTSHKERNEGMSYFCEICSKAFSDRRRLRIHNDGVHKKIKPFLCSCCNYKGATRSALRMHMRQHTGEKPFGCDTCAYTTADHNSLRRHKLRHSGEKPYKCVHCEYACIQSSTYKVHLKTKHPGFEKELLFSCPNCSFRSINKDIFRSHISTVHM